MKIVKISIIGVLVLFLMMSLPSVAQSKLKVKETHGDVFKQEGRFFLDVVELPDGGYMSLSAGSAGAQVSIGLFIRFHQVKPMFYAQIYDKNMNLIEQKHLDIDKNGKNLTFEKLVRFQNEFYVFLSFLNEKDKKKYLFYSKLNPEKLALEGDLIKIAEVKDPAAKDGFIPSSFDISLSDNENYVVVFGKDADEIKRKKRGFFSKLASQKSKIGTHSFVFTYWVLNKDFEIVNYDKKHTLKLEESSDKFYVRDYAVDEKGAIYILGKNDVVDELTRSEVKAKKSATWIEINKSAFVLEKINADGSKVQYVTPENTLYVDMNILFDKEGKINLVGLNGEQVYSKLATTGVSRFVLDDGLNEISDVSSNFSEKVLENVNDIQESENAINSMQNKNRKSRIQKRVKKRASKLSAEEKAYLEIKKRAALNVNHIAYSGLDEYGDAVIVLEEQHLEIVTRTTTNSNGVTTTTTTYYYHYDDLIFTKFMDEEVVQNYYKKHYVSINAPLQKSIDVSLKGGEVSIITQGHIVKSDIDLEKVKDGQLKAFDRKEKVPGMKNKFFTYRKAVNEDTILTPAQSGKKVVWYKVSVD